MGMISARHARECLRDAEAAIAMEVLAAAQACELRAPLLAGPATRAAIASLRKVVPSLVQDRALKPDVDATIAPRRLRESSSSGGGEIGPFGVNRRDLRSATVVATPGIGISARWTERRPQPGVTSGADGSSEPRSGPDPQARRLRDGRQRAVGSPTRLPRNRRARRGPRRPMFDTVEGALDLGLSWLTMFAFSTEKLAASAWTRCGYLMHFNEGSSRAIATT